MPNQNDSDHIHELVEQLNRLRSAAELLEESKNSLDKAKTELTSKFDGIEGNINLLDIKLDQTTGILQTQFETLVRKVDFDALQDEVARVRQKLLESNNQQPEQLPSEEAIAHSKQLATFKREWSEFLDSQLQNLEQRLATLNIKIEALEQTMAECYSTIEALQIKVANDLITESKEREHEYNRLKNRIVKLEGSFGKESNNTTPVEIHQLDIKLQDLRADFKSLYNELLLVEERFDQIPAPQPVPESIISKLDDHEVHLKHVFSILASHRSSYKWLSVVFILISIIFSGAILAILMN